MTDPVAAVEIDGVTRRPRPKRSQVPLVGRSGADQRLCRDPWRRAPCWLDTGGCGRDVLSSVTAVEGLGQWVVQGDTFVSVRGSLLRPHACTNSAAHVRWGVRPPQMANRRAAAGAVCGPEERTGTLRNARERCGDKDGFHILWLGGGAIVSLAGEEPLGVGSWGCGALRGQSPASNLRSSSRRAGAVVVGRREDRNTEQFCNLACDWPTASMRNAALALDPHAAAALS